MVKRTPLYEAHIACFGKMVEFAGYMLPIQYTGLIEEHMAVRTKAGIFDVSHMGEIVIKGEDALKNINNLFTNDFTNLKIGGVRYTLMCNEKGGIVDDLIVYKMGDNEFFLVVNAANKDKDFEWIKSHIYGNAQALDVSDDFAQIAIQGPNSLDIIKELVKESDIPEKYYSFTNDCNIKGASVLISRTGYTGELGFEIYCSPKDANLLWNSLLEVGGKYGLIPCGLGARDTLRLEASMPLYGCEMNDEITPLEAKLDFAVKLNKPDFIGKTAIIEHKTPNIRVGLQITGKGISRGHDLVYIGNEQLGTITSGTYLPYLKGAYAMAMVKEEYSSLDTEVEVDVRGRRVTAKIIELPFIKK